MAVGGWALNAIQDEDTELNGKPDDWLGLPLGRAGSPSPPLSQSRFASPSANGRFGEPSLPEEDPKHPIQIPTSLASEPARYRGEQTAQRAIPTYENKKGVLADAPFNPAILYTPVTLTGRTRRFRRYAWLRSSTRSSRLRYTSAYRPWRPWEPSQPWPSRCWKRRGYGGSRWS